MENTLKEVLTMAKVVLSRPLVKKQNTNEIYFYKAGAIRDELKIYSYLPSEVLPANEPIPATLKLFKDRNEAVITLEVETEPSDTVLGIGIFKAYAISVFNENANAFIFTAYSHSALESGLICVAKEGAIVKLHSYKNRNPASYVVFNGEKWLNLGTKAEILASSTAEAELVRKTLGWDSDVLVIN